MVVQPIPQGLLQSNRARFRRESKRVDHETFQIGVGSKEFHRHLNSVTTICPLYEHHLPHCVTLVPKSILQTAVLFRKDASLSLSKLLTD